MFRKVLLVCTACAGAAGCALPPIEADTRMSPPRKLLTVPGLAIDSGKPSTGGAGGPEKSVAKIPKNPGNQSTGVPQVITLSAAYNLILEKSPELAGSYMGVRMEEARVLQAGLIPNPEVEVELEEFGGTKDRRGLGSSEVRLVFSQEIETGNKRARRVSVARRKKVVASWDYVTKRADLFQSAATALVDVVAAQQRLKVQTEDLRLARRLLQVTRAKVDAGDLSPVELDQARVRFSTSRISFRQAKANLSAARSRLAAFWGSQTPGFRTASFAGFKRSKIATLPAYIERVGKSPELSKKNAELYLARAELGLERARTIPNFSIGAGTTRYIENGESAFLVQLSVPLPVYGMNKGNLSAARYRLRQSELDLRTQADKLAADIRITYQQIKASQADISDLDKTGIPSARRAVSAAVIGFREGKFDFLAVLDSQRSLLDLQLRRVTAIQEYWTARAKLSRLVGQTILQRPNNPSE